MMQTPVLRTSLVIFGISLMGLPGILWASDQSFLLTSYFITAGHSIIVSIALLVVLRRNRKQAIKQKLVRKNALDEAKEKGEQNFGLIHICTQLGRNNGNLNGLKKTITGYDKPRENEASEKTFGSCEGNKDRIKSKGMSLVEVMAAAGIMAGLSLVVAQMMKNQNEVMVHSEARGEELEIYTQMRTVLARKEACESTFQGTSLGNEITAIRNSSDNIVYEVGDVYGNRALQLDGLTLTNQNVPPAGGLGEAILEVETTRLKKDNGQRQMTREIMLQVNADASGKVIECYSETDNTIETAKSEMCEAINGIYDPSSGLCDLNCITDPGESNEAVSSECLDGLRADERQISEDAYVNVDGDTMTGDLDVQADITALNAKVSNEICVGPNCRDFTEQKCPDGKVVSKVRGDGSLECVDLMSGKNCTTYWGKTKEHGKVWYKKETCTGKGWGKDKLYQCWDGIINTLMSFNRSCT